MHRNVIKFNLIEGGVHIFRFVWYSDLDVFVNRQQVSFSLGPFYWHGLNLIQTWIINHMSGKVLDEITYPFPNFDGETIEVWEWICSFIASGYQVVDPNHTTLPPSCCGKLLLSFGTFSMCSMRWRPVSPQRSDTVATNLACEIAVTK